MLIAISNVWCNILKCVRCVWVSTSIRVHQMNIFTACVKKMESDRSKGNNKWTYSSSRNNHTIKTICVLKVLGDTNWAIKTVLNERRKKTIWKHRIPEQMEDDVSYLLKWISKISVFRLFFGHKGEYININMCIYFMTWDILLQNS